MKSKSADNKQDNANLEAPEQAQEVSQDRGIGIPRSLTVNYLAELLGVSPVVIIKVLMRNGIMATINQVIDYTTANLVATELELEVYEEKVAVAKSMLGHPNIGIEDAGSLKVRPPVVTIMGHVDHGKTRLLDAIRQTNVMDSEAGGITQHIGAYQAKVSGQKITFLDTPGHQAFTAMRARGAQLTDIAILVVAADDGVMPQTIEAINHAKDANVPIVVAINKTDKPGVDVERVKQQLAENDVLIEEWGGDVICVPISAKSGEGIPELLENLLIVAEVMELRANPDRRAVGLVIEAEMDKSKGPLATVLIQAGTLKVGDSIVTGNTWGKVKAMFNYQGKHIRKAGPATPVEIMGLNSVPEAGDELRTVTDERAAKVLIEKIKREKESQSAKSVALEDIYAHIKSGQVKELKLILKTDVQGSIEPIRNSLQKLEVEGIKVRVSHYGTGNITESDVNLAIASKAIIIGFNTVPEIGARRLADSEGVDIRSYDIIYHLVEDIEKALRGMLEPVYVDVIDGHAEVRVVFSVGKSEKAAGCYVTDGKIMRNALARVVRGGQSIHESTISSLKHFKDDVREMSAGFECGIGIEGFNDIQVGDIIETYHKEQTRR